MTKIIQIVIFIFSYLATAGPAMAYQYADNDEELNCLARALYFEARGEGYVGMRAVGHTILNRAKNRNLTLCQTIYQPSSNDNYYACSFSFYCDGKPEVIRNKKAWELAVSISYGLLNNWYPFSSVGEADHYLVCKIKNRIYWTKHMKFVTKIKRHCFYNSKIKK